MADKTDRNAVPAETPSQQQDPLLNINVVNSDGTSSILEVDDTGALENIAKQVEVNLGEYGQTLNSGNDDDGAGMNNDAGTGMPGSDAPSFENIFNAAVSGAGNNNAAAGNAAAGTGFPANQAPNQPDIAGALAPVIDEIKNLTSKIASTNETDELQKEINTLTTAEQAWTHKLAQAKHSKDVAAEAQAQAQISNVQMRRIDAERRQKEAKSNPAGTAGTAGNNAAGNQANTGNAAGSEASNMTPAGQAWVAKHDAWFRKPGFENQTLDAITFAEQLANAGYDPAQPSFYTAVEAKLGEKYGKSGGNQHMNAGNQGAGGTMPASGGGSNRDSVNLTPTHVKIMRDLGLDARKPEDQVKIRAISQSYKQRKARNLPNGR